MNKLRLSFQSPLLSTLLVGRGSIPHRIFSSSHARVQTNNLSLYITNGIEIYQIIILILSTSYVFPTNWSSVPLEPVLLCSASNLCLFLTAVDVLDVDWCLLGDTNLCQNWTASCFSEEGKTIFAIITQNYETFLLVEMREKKASNVLMLENIKTKVYCSKVFLPITYHLLMIHFFLFFFRETQEITLSKKNSRPSAIFQDNQFTKGDQQPECLLFFRL